MNASRFLTALFAALIASVSIARLSAEIDETPYTVITVPGGLSLGGSQNSVIKAAIGCSWNILQKTEVQVVIHLAHLGYDSTLAFKIEDTKVSIFSDSWTTNKKGERKERKDLEGWLENLRKDILVFMNRELYG